MVRASNLINVNVFDVWLRIRYSWRCIAGVRDLFRNSPPSIFIPNFLFSSIIRSPHSGTASARSVPEPSRFAWSSDEAFA